MALTTTQPPSFNQFLNIIFLTISELDYKIHTRKLNAPFTDLQIYGATSLNYYNAAPCLHL